jgi:hypothetical protein
MIIFNEWALFDRTGNLQEACYFGEILIELNSQLTY